MILDKAHEQIERLAETLVLADAGDLPSLAALHTEFEAVATWVQEAGHPRLAEAARASASWLEKIILEEVDDPERVLKDLSLVVASFQDIVRDGRSAEGMRWPARLGLDDDEQAAASETVATFLKRRKSAIDGLRQAVLSFEAGGDVAAIGELKHVIQNLREESLALGLTDMKDLSVDHVETVSQLKEVLAYWFALPEGIGTDSDVDAAPAAADVEESPCDSDLTVPEGRPLEGDLSLLGEFVNEAREHLDAADINLLKLESADDEEHPDALNAVFRAFHTIKGVAGFLALNEIQGLSHEAENLLDRARKHELTLAGPAMDVVFDSVDMMKRLVTNVSEALNSGGPLASTPELSELISRVKAVASGKASPVAQRVDLPFVEPDQPLGEILVQSGAASPEAVKAALKTQKDLSGPQMLGDILVRDGKVLPTHVNMALDAQRDDPEHRKIGEMLVEMGVVSSEDVEAGLQQQRTGASGPKLGVLLVQAGQAAPKDVAQALRAQETQQPQASGRVRETVKVDADRLDLLVDTIGELVIAESMVNQSGELRSGRSTTLARSLTQLNKITRELQEMGTSLRMVPIRATFQKMARLVRDLARKSGKHVEFVSIGEDTELDKTVVDKIGDPLVHMVRNAVDHGLEASPEERSKAGKPLAGRVELRAFHKGGSIYIEIQDDGRGLDREAILAKARSRGLVREGEVLSDHDVWNLIFEPGLSTAKTVTDVSGRGVGMDVVKRNIEMLRGQVDIQSQSGKGSTFSIRLPLTLAIIDGMVVRVGNERYVLPTLSIVMSTRPNATQISTVVGQGEMLELQGQLLPLFRLARLFDIKHGTQDIMEGIVIIVEDEGRRTGLLVDEILGQQQIVIKPLGQALQGIPGIAGGAIMSDGMVGLILDVGGVVRLTSDENQSPSYAAIAG